MFSCEFCEISKNTFLHRILLVAASAQGKKNGETTESNENFDCYTITKFKSKYVNIKTIHPIFLTFFSYFLSLDSRIFIFSVYGLSFKSRHLELFCKTAVWQNITKIVLFFYVKLDLFSVQFIKYEQFTNLLKMKCSTGIFLGLWTKGPTCNFTEQLFFLQNCEWLLPIII